MKVNFKYHPSSQAQAMTFIAAPCDKLNDMTNLILWNNIVMTTDTVCVLRCKC